MREIKFRSINKWFDDSKMIYFDLDSHCSYQKIKEDSYPNSNWEVMQYTGLKDKNGKEIYEGDIVAYPDTFTEKVDVGVGEVPVAQSDETSWGTVVMEDYMWGLKIDMQTESLDKGFNAFNEIYINFGLDELEIIGNVFQNPELIK